MVGTDTWGNGQWERYQRIVAASRLWLARLPRSVAERIAHGNAERLFKREVTADLIGRRRWREFGAQAGTGWARPMASSRY